MMNRQKYPSVDYRLPFRTGFPSPLPALPVKTIDAYRTPSDSVEVKTRIVQLLNANRVDYSEISICYRYNGGMPGPEQDINQMPVYLVRSEMTSPEDIEKWRYVASRVGSMLQERIQEPIGFEIIDEKIAGSTGSGAILSEETEILKIWENLIPKIPNCLSGCDWLSVDLLHRQWTEDLGFLNIEATVVISASDANLDRWDNGPLESLKGLLPEYLELELVYLDTVLSVQPEGYRERQMHKPELEYAMLYPNLVLPGGSCGPHWQDATKSTRSDKSGTFGGLVRLKGAEQEFGLTNHHVIFEDKKDGSNHILKLDDKRIKDGGVSISSPAYIDIDIALDDITTEIDDQKELLEMLGDKAPDYPAALDTKRRLESRKDKLEKLLLEPDIGSVFASSGCSAIVYEEMRDIFWGKWQSDWCLIKMNPARKLIEQQPSSSIAAASVYQKIDPYKNYQVLKHGKRTGKTAGKVNAAPTLLSGLRSPRSEPYPTVMSFKKDEWPQLKNDGENQRQARLCHSIIGEKQEEQKEKEKEKEGIEKGKKPKVQFMLHGDSGSFVLLQKPIKNQLNDGTTAEVLPVVGLVFNSNEHVNVGYMMPFDLVVRHIRDVTGYEVSYPPCAGVAESE